MITKHINDLAEKGVMIGFLNEKLEQFYEENRKHCEISDFAADVYLSD
jgi:hypothetical protein